MAPNLAFPNYHCNDPCTVDGSCNVRPVRQEESVAEEPASVSSGDSAGLLTNEIDLRHYGRLGPSVDLWRSTMTISQLRRRLAVISKRSVWRSAPVLSQKRKLL